VLHSQPKSTVGTPAYIAPEVLLKKEYDGKVICNSNPSKKNQLTNGILKISDCDVQLASHLLNVLFVCT